MACFIHLARARSYSQQRESGLLCHPNGRRVPRIGPDRRASADPAGTKKLTHLNHRVGGHPLTPHPRGDAVRDVHIPGVESICDLEGVIDGSYTGTLDPNAEGPLRRTLLRGGYQTLDVSPGASHRADATAKPANCQMVFSGNDSLSILDTERFQVDDRPPSLISGNPVGTK